MPDTVTVVVTPITPTGSTGLILARWPRLVVVVVVGGTEEVGVGDSYSLTRTEKGTQNETSEGRVARSTVPRGGFVQRTEQYFRTRPRPANTTGRRLPKRTVEPDTGNNNRIDSQSLPLPLSTERL